MLDSITKYDIISVEYVCGVRNVQFGQLPPVEVEFPGGVWVTLKMSVLPEEFFPNVNIFPIQVLRSNGCILDFRGNAPRVIFRPTSKESEQVFASFGCPCLNVKECKTLREDASRKSREHQLILDTGSGCNVINTKFLKALCGDANKNRSEGFHLTLCRDPELMASQLVVADVANTKFLLGTGFLLRHRAVCDFETMKLYVKVGSRYHGITLANEWTE